MALSGQVPASSIGEFALIVRDLDRIAAADRHEPLVVGLEILRGERVAASVALACGRDLQLHEPTSQRSGSVSRAIIAPPPRSCSVASESSSKFGITASHS